MGTTADITDDTLARVLAEQDADADPEAGPAAYWSDAYRTALRFTPRERFAGFTPTRRRERFRLLARAGATL